MNPDWLLKHFEQISEAPDAVPRLRRFILDLAVRGKLVEQDPKDEPVVKLLEAINQQCDLLRKTGDFREHRSAFVIQNKDLPFSVPGSWGWCRLIELADVSYGFAFSSAKFNNRRLGMPLIRIRDISSSDTQAYFDGEFEPAYLVKQGDFLVGMDGAFNLRKWRGPEGLLNQRVMRIKNWRCGVAPDYVAIPLQQILDHLHGDTSQTTVKHLSAKQVNGINVPLPPLAEQHRIVAKVDELMALCDELEAARVKREKRRDRLVAATLHGLNNSASGKEFRENARFCFNHLPRLTTRPEHIHQLRQTVLNLAVRGKLVPQDPKDEPASRLIERIQTEMAQRTKKAKLGRKPQLPPIDEANAPFALPSGWTWARFHELGEFGRGKSKHRPRNDPSLFEGGTHLLVQTGDVARSNGVIETFTGKYNDVGLAQSAKWPKGTLCITIAANIADSGILGFDACFPDSVVGFIPASPIPNARYFEYFIRTVKAELLEFAPATAQKNINLGILNEVLIPLPPLAEQHRIVARVDELMTLCDELEARLTTVAATRHQLLEATLHEALAEGN